MMVNFCCELPQHVGVINIPMVTNQGEKKEEEGGIKRTGTVSKCARRKARGEREGEREGKREREKERANERAR